MTASQVVLFTQETLYTNAHPLGLTVLGPSVGHPTDATSLAFFPDVSAYVDIVNAHLYDSTTAPLPIAAVAASHAKFQGAEKPLRVTETGLSAYGTVTTTRLCPLEWVLDPHGPPLPKAADPALERFRFYRQPSNLSRGAARTRGRIVEGTVAALKALGLGALEPDNPPWSEGDRLFRAVFNGALDALLLADDHGVYVDANPSACEVMGLSRDKVIGRRVADFAEPGLDIAAVWRQFLKDGTSEGRFRLFRPDGTTRDLDFRATAHVIPGLHLSVLRDMTEGRRTESRFHAMVERSLDGVTLADAAGNVLYTSPATSRTLGITPEELVGKSGFDFVDAEDRARSIAKWTEVVATPGVPITYEINVVHRDGSRRNIEVTVTNFLDDPAIGAIVINFRNITERKRAQEVRNRLAAIVESSEDAIISKDLAGIITSWNHGATRLYQWSEEEMAGQPAGVLVPSNLRDQQADLLARMLQGEVIANYETERLRKDGSLMPVALTLSPIRDSGGRTIGVSESARDLTARHAAEAKLRETEEQLRQSQKMEAVGALAGGIAHDFNNLLSVILGYTNIVLAEMNGQEPLRVDVEEVYRAGERAADLTRQLLAFSRQQMLQPRALDLGQVLRGMDKMLRRILGEDIELSLTIGRDVGNVHADPSQVEQIILNLAVNARDAMPEGGRLALEIANAHLDDVYAAEHHGARPGPHVVLSVSDTGVGMDEATRERIFEPFFTTKEIGKGTGLGLSTVFGIVKQSKGHVWVTTAVGHGTTFEIYFPCTEHVASVEAPPPPARAQRRGSETVLLVEDEDQLRAMMRTILRRQGYTVLDAQNAGEAFLICEKYHGVIHLLLTDVVMPRMNGRALAERLALVRPDMRVLYMSGYVETSALRLGLDGDFAFLQKPITPDTLLRKVGDVLDTRVGNSRALD